MKPALSVIIPARNEEAVVGSTLKDLERNLSLAHEVIVVDDHSSDRTPSVVLAFRETSPNVRLLSNPYAPGFPRALRFGWENAAADVVVPLMADLCDDVGTIPEMLRKIGEGYDVVVGSRYMKGGGKTGGNPLQNLFSRFVGLSMHWLIGIPTHDVPNAFKMYRKEVLKRLRPAGVAFDVSMEMTLQAFFLGFRVTEVPTFWRGRTEGRSKFRLVRMAPGYIRLYEKALLCRLGLRRMF